MAVKPEETLMFSETKEAPAKLAKQLAENKSVVEALARNLQNAPPPFVVTCARGSSDHAASFGKYAIETQTGRVVASLGPSIASIYGVQCEMKNALYIAISQSGASPDIITHAEMAKKAGAIIVAIVNDVSSPLAALAHILLPMHAGPEKSVAATKTYIASLTALSHLVAVWKQDRALMEGLERLPEQLEEAFELDWSGALEVLTPAKNMFVIGRGLGYGTAQEAALKYKETCGLHAEPFSSAEVKHGPQAIIGEGFPVLIFSQKDACAKGILETLEQFRKRGSRVLFAGEGAAASPDNLPVIKNMQPLFAPIAIMESFYKMTNALAIQRGFHPDKPPHLQKVTQTL